MYKITIPIQSYSDLITNSSSEIFCRISSDQHIYSIAALLNSIFPKECGVIEDEDSTYIDFEVEIGAFDECSETKEQFMSMLNYILSLTYNPDDFKIETNIAL